jgi:hypothetical protein
MYRMLGNPEQSRKYLTEKITVLSVDNSYREVTEPGSSRAKREISYASQVFDKIHLRNVFPRSILSYNRAQKPGAPIRLTLCQNRISDSRKMRQNVSNRTFYSYFRVEIRLARSLHRRDFMMKRCAFLITLVAGIGLFRPVQAQSSLDALVTGGGVTCEVTYLGDDAYAGSEDIGKDDCENATVTFKVTGPAVSYTAETGLGCDSNNTDKCREIANGEISSFGGSDTFDISVKDLLAEYGGDCALADQTIRVRIFYDDEYDERQSEACTEITVDTVGSLPPTEVKGTSGEHEINITWTKVSDITDYKVYYKVIDDCEDTVEAANKAFNSFMETWESLVSNPDAQVIADAGTIDPDDVDPNWLIVNTFDDDESEGAQGTNHTLRNKAEPGEELLVRVTAVDDGGNESAFSDAICVRVIRTRGFCDSTDKCKDGCSVEPIGKERTHATAGVVIGLSALLALVWARRRSRS